MFTACHSPMVDGINSPRHQGQFAGDDTIGKDLSIMTDVKIYPYYTYHTYSISPHLTSLHQQETPFCAIVVLALLGNLLSQQGTLRR